MLEAIMAPVLALLQKALRDMENVQADQSQVEEQWELLGKLWQKLLA